MLKEKDYSILAKNISETFTDSSVCVAEPMSKHTTFRIGGPADIYIEPSTKEMVSIIDYLNNQQIPFLVIGNGSNLLVSDAGVEGAVLSLGKNASEINVDGTLATAEAGALLSSVAAAALRESLTGFEFAAGIPGTVGGAVYMNAGAYGGEIKNILVSARVLTPEHKIVDLSAEELDLSYRHSSLMTDGGYVLSATFRLEKGNTTEIKSQMDELREKRVTKQPLNFPSAGSTFKRPEGYFAGKLIEDSGLRGYSIGGAQVSEKHCGFVVNKGNATCEDVLTLMKNVDAIVFEKFGVHLEPEVRFIGRSNS